MVQRSVRQHHAEFVILRSDPAEFDSCRREHDGTGDRGEQRFRFRRKLDQSAGHLDIPHHQCEGFFFPVLAIPQSRDGSGIPGIACQVVPAESFHRENPASTKNLGRPADAPFASIRGFIVVRLNLRVKIVAGTASWTSHGLRVKTTIAGIEIFRGTVIVEQPVFHGGVRPVVRQSQHDGVARPAIGAVDVGIQVARIGGIEEFFQALIANRQVR